MFKKRTIQTIATVVTLGVVNAVLAVEPVAEKAKPKPFFVAAEMRTPSVVIGITQDERLVSVDMRWGTVREYEAFKGVLPSLEVHEDHACLTTGKEILCVSLASGDVQRVPHALGSRVAAGFIGRDRLFAQNGNRLQVFRRDNGKQIHDIVLSAKTQKQRYSSVFKMQPYHAIHGSQLFVALLGRGIAVVNVDEGRLLKVLDSDYTITGLVVTDGKLFSKTVMVGYGITYEGMQIWELATLKLGMEKQLSLERMRGGRMRMAHDGTWIGDMVVAGGLLNVAIDGDILRITPDGRLVGVAKNAIQPNEHLVSDGTSPFVTFRREVGAVRFPKTKSSVAAAQDVAK